jgi:hypothetical protein
MDNQSGRFVLPLTYEEANKLLSGRFDINILDQIFQSWRNSFRMEDLQSLSAVIYEHDHHKYRSDMYVDNYTDNGRKYQNFCIKLANNGFLYPRESDFKVKATGLPRHHSTTWALLETEYVRHFPAITVFCKEYFASDDIKFKMYYNFLEDRFDFKAFAATDFSRGLVITFEPFPACDEDFDPDHWSSLP